MDKDKCLKILSGFIAAGNKSLSGYTEGKHKERLKEKIDALNFAKKAVKNYKNKN